MQCCPASPPPLPRRCLEAHCVGVSTDTRKHSLMLALITCQQCRLSPCMYQTFCSSTGSPRGLNQPSACCLCRYCGRADAESTAQRERLGLGNTDFSDLVTATKMLPGHAMRFQHEMRKALLGRA